MKKFIILLLSILILINSLIINASAAFTDSLETDAGIAYLVSADDESGVIYDKNSELRCDPGALVKIVTAILVIENCEDLSQSVTASGTAIRSIEHLGVTTAGILVGETMTVEELLYCLLVYNANDAANVLAEFIDGTNEKFVDRMNDFAKGLGLTDTGFSNPGGYDSQNQYTTARDMAVMFRYCMEKPVFAKIISTFLYEMPATNKYHETRYLKNTNYLINTGIGDYYVKSVKGGKSGNTANGNCNVVSVASKDGYNYVCVVMDAPMKNTDEDESLENMSFVTSKKLYEWAFSNIKLRVVANTSTYVGEVKVRLSDEFDYVSLVPVENVSALVPSGVTAESVLIEPISELTAEQIDAPVKKGDVLGRAAIKYAGETVAEVDLVAAFDVKLSPVKFVTDKIISILTSPAFIILFIVVLVVLIPLCFISYRNKRKLRLKKLREQRNNIKRG